MNIERMSAPLGAVVTGVDVRDVDAGAVARLRSAFAEHKVLVFPQQNLTPEQQCAFARHWGELVRHPYASMKDHPEIIELVNQGKRRDVNQHWHSDMTYNELPPKLTMLYALEAPSFGGETAFSNQVLAYQEISEGLRQVLDGLTALHSAEGLARLYGEDPAQAPRAEHPLVRTHDETGEKALYACRAFTTQIVGWSRAESRTSRARRTPARRRSKRAKRPSKKRRLVARNRRPSTAARRRKSSRKKRKPV